MTGLLAAVEEQVLIAVDIGTADHDFEFLVAHDSVAAFGIELVHIFADFQDQGIGLVDRILPGEAEVGIDPVRDGRGASAAVLSDADREKIGAARVNRYLDLLESSVFSEAALREIQEREMEVTAKVRPGTEEAQSDRASALGFSKSSPAKKLNTVSLRGTFAQILEFVKENEDTLLIEHTKVGNVTI